MSTVSSFYTTTMLIQRYVVPSGQRVGQLTTIASGVSCKVPTAESDLAKIIKESDWGKQFNTETDPTVNIKVGDICTIRNSKYGVIGVSLIQDIFESKDSFKTIILNKKTSGS